MEQLSAGAGVVTNPVGTAIEVIGGGLADNTVKGSTVSEQLQSVHGQVINPVGTVISVIGGGLKKVLGLAGGGAVAPNSPMPYILGDNTREYEVVSPVSLMEETVISAMKKMGVTGTQGGSSGPVEITIELDGKKLARAIYDPLETEKRRRGVRA